MSEDWFEDLREQQERSAAQITFGGSPVNDLLALASRCEKATESSLELDALIAHAIHGSTGHAFYTSSIDAAMTLVPEGNEWECGTAHLINASWAAVIATKDDYKARGRTPALALCAAALRAREDITAPVEPSGGRGK